MSTLPSGLPEFIAEEEDLTRFLVQRNQFTSKMVKPAAFLPSPKHRETSVSRHGSEPRESLWSLGRAVAVDRNLYGAAVFKAQTVRLAKLDVLADEPPPLHAAIRGWPWYENDPDLQKAQQKEKALEIAGQSKLLLC